MDYETGIGFSKILLNNRYNLVHDVIYNYYRQGLDKMYENEANGRTQILKFFSQLQTINQENPNSMIVQFFMQGKSQELIRIFKKAFTARKIKSD